MDYTSNDLEVAQFFADTTNALDHLVQEGIADNATIYSLLENLVRANSKKEGITYKYVIAQGLLSLYFPEN
jgi:hypothetical protein